MGRLAPLTIGGFGFLFTVGFLFTAGIAWGDQDRHVVDVHKQGHQREHRLITGKLAYSDPARSQIKLWTPEGVQSFPIKLEEARLQNISEGTNVTVGIDEQGRLMGYS